MSDIPGRAFNSFLLLLANVSVALATALIFLGNKINYRKFKLVILIKSRNRISKTCSKKRFSKC